MGKTIKHAKTDGGLSQWSGKQVGISRVSDDGVVRHHKNDGGLSNGITGGKPLGISKPIGDDLHHYKYRDGGGWDDVGKKVGVSKMSSGGPEFTGGSGIEFLGEIGNMGATIIAVLILCLAIVAISLIPYLGILLFAIDFVSAIKQKRMILVIRGLAMLAGCYGVFYGFFAVFEHTFAALFGPAYQPLNFTPYRSDSVFTMFFAYRSEWVVRNCVIAWSICGVMSMLYVSSKEWLGQRERAGRISGIIGAFCLAVPAAIALRSSGETFIQIFATLGLPTVLVFAGIKILVDRAIK